jgi:endo-1,4-beta-xylanase
VRTFPLKIFVLTIGVGVAGCGSSDTQTPTGGVGGGQAVGGSTSEGTSVIATGGSVAATGGSLGVATGGNAPATGGSVATTGGSVAATGGSPAVATGGNAPATGGSVAATGGSPPAATGGAAPATGGTTAAGTGGSPAATGGTQPDYPATGGMGPTPTGGSIGFGTGGATTGAGGKTTGVGGKSTAGGAAATGGLASTTGGSTSPPSTTARFVGNITTGNAVDPSGLKYSKYWDQITPENQGKWGSVQSTPTSSLNWGSLDSIYSYTQTNSIIFKQHTFFWGPQQPNPASGVTLAIAENWVKSFCQRYTATKVIDVVNEPPPHTTPGYTSALGAGESGQYPWITKAFKLARQYCPNAILILNDYNNLEYASQETNFINIVKDIKANGASIDGVGCQGHALKGISASSLQSALNTLNTGTGLPVYISEYDINDASDSGQESSYSTHFNVFLNTSYIKGITVWGWIVGRTWMTNSGIVNGTTPRPAMTWLMTKLGRPVPPN